MATYSYSNMHTSKTRWQYSFLDPTEFCFLTVTATHLEINSI